AARGPRLARARLGRGAGHRRPARALRAVAAVGVLRGSSGAPRGGGAAVPLPPLPQGPAGGRLGAARRGGGAVSTVAAAAVRRAGLVRTAPRCRAAGRGHPL